MKLWVDDFRDAPDDSWTEVRKVEAAIRALSLFRWDEISLDHDIENRPDDETFKSVVYYIAAKYWHDVPVNGDMRVMRLNHVPRIKIHSDNPVGARDMQDILKAVGINAPWEPFTTNEEFKTKYGL